MFFVFASRTSLITHAGPPGTIQAMVELGVYEGEFASHCYRVLRPARYTLVDFWDYDRYAFVLPNAPQMRDLRSIYEGYFRGDPRKALAEAERKVRTSFADKSNVEVLKLDIAEAAARFPENSLDIIYLDGNHTYEYVLRDLMTWWPKLRQGGLFVCNDFFESTLAARQNLGVIPAWLTFSKRVRTYPIALSANDWSDFYFSNQPDSDTIRRFTSGILGGDEPIVDIPEDAIPNVHHSLRNVGDGRQRLVPVLRSGAA